MIRWPGGCFADSYDWRDGIGPRDERPRRTNFWGDAPEWPKRAGRPWKYEPNTSAPASSCDSANWPAAKPYIAANLRSLPAKDF